MKILHIIDSGGLYGAEIMLFNLLNEQVNRGQDATIASLGEIGIAEKPFESEAIKRGYRVKKFRMRAGPNFAGAMRVLKYAHKEGFEILHSHGYKGNILFGFMPKYIRKLPLVTTLHGWTSTSGISKMRLYEWLDVQSLRFIDAVVVVNEIMLTIPRLQNRKDVNLLVVNNGIRQFDFSKKISACLKKDSSPVEQKLDHSIIDFCQDGFTFGSIGRLSKEKGYNFLIEAFYQLVKEGLDAKLVIIGDGYERSTLENMAADFHLQDRVLLPGYRDNAKLYLPFFKAFVMSSLTEGLPITLLEAMQSTVPIVATYVGGIPDALDKGQAGMLVEAGNPEALTGAMRQLYCDEKLGMRLSETAYHRVVSKYSSKNMALGYHHIYSNILKRPIS